MITVYWDNGHDATTAKTRQFKRFSNALNFARKLNQTNPGYMDITTDTEIGYYDKYGCAKSELVAGESYQLEHIEQWMEKYS